MTVTAAQIRAGRGLVHWTAKDLADRIGITPSSMSAIENEQSKGSVQTMQAIEAALVGAGVEFISNDGVRITQNFVRMIEGADCYLKLLQEATSLLSDNKGEFLSSAADERRSPPAVIEQFRKMRAQGITMRSLIRDQDTFFMGKADEYRWMKPELFVDGDVKVIFGETVAYLATWWKVPRVIAIKDAKIADEARRNFNFIWESSEQPARSTSPVTYEEGKK